MLVEYVWPDCYRIAGNRLDTPVDAFWVECMPEELGHICRYITATAEPAVYPALPCWWREGEPLTHFFLVTKDLHWVWPQSRDVLHSSQWYRNPFRQLPQAVRMEHVQELALIIVPEELRASPTL